MMKRSMLFVFLFFFQFIYAQHPVHFEITALPFYHDDTSSVYLAGSFNQWKPGEPSYKFTRDTKGNYMLDINLDSLTHEFKITRGTWATVEVAADGSSVNNRVIHPGDHNIQVAITGWADHFQDSKPSSASRNVCLLDTAFFIPQLNRTRRISIYLPAKYCDDKKKYPVLYLQDGQNMFDASRAFAGEWGVDDFMDSTNLDGCIIVAIDHGGDKRITEYIPYQTDRFKTTEGEKYADFIAQTLKPFIDKKFRTLKKKENNFIVGSSLGGLISFYTILKYPKKFGGAGIFSPSFWIDTLQLVHDIQRRGEKYKGKIYFYAGKAESESMVTDMLKIFEAMAAVSKAKMTTIIRDEGKHNETAWRNEFPLFYRWLIKD